MNQSSTQVRRGDIVKVLWRDACEGPEGKDLTELSRTRLRDSTTITVSTIGRYLRVANGYLILDDVLREESEGKLLYEKQAAGKWISIPLGVIIQVTPVTGIEEPISREAKRRRIIFKQLRFIPRSKRLPSGEISRMLYMT